jgi:hypothetical protein
LRGRHYNILAYMSIVIGIVLSFAGVGWGAMVLGFSAGFGWVSFYSFTQGVRLASDKLLTDRLSMSIGPKAKWVTLPAIEVDGESEGKKARVWKESWAIPLGGGYLSSINIGVPGIGEWGLLIIAKEYLYDLNGQYIGFGHTIPMKPHHRQMRRDLNNGKPQPKDRRELLPQSWWAIFSNMDGWKEYSPIFVIQDSCQPIIHPGKPELLVDGLPPIKLGDLYFEEDDAETGKMVLVQLKTRLPKDSPIIDCRKGMEQEFQRDAQNARDAWGALETAKDRRIRSLERDLEGLAAVDDRLAPPSLFEWVGETAGGGAQETAERRG